MLRRACSIADPPQLCRGYRRIVGKTRHYGPTPSDIHPHIPPTIAAEPEVVLNTRSQKKRGRPFKDVTAVKLVRGTPEHSQKYSELMTARQLLANQETFVELITTGQKRTLESFKHNDSFRYRLSFFGHKLYFPTLTVSIPGPQANAEPPSYNVLTLLSLRPNEDHPFSCRKLPSQRKLKRLEGEDSRLNQFAIKLRFERPVFKEKKKRADWYWIPAGDPLLTRLLEVYNSFKHKKEGKEIESVCRNYYDKYVVQNQQIPVQW